MLKKDDYVVVAMSGDHEGKEAVIKVNSIPYDNLADCSGYHKDLGIFQSGLDPRQVYKLADREQIQEFDNEYEKIVQQNNEVEISDVLDEMNSMTNKQKEYLSLESDKKWIPKFIEYLQNEERNDFYHSISEKYGNDNTFTDQFLERAVSINDHQNLLAEELTDKEKSDADSILKAYDPDIVCQAVEREKENRFNELYSQHLAGNKLSASEQIELVSIDSPLNGAVKINNRLAVIGTIENKDTRVQEKERQLNEIKGYPDTSQQYFRNEYNELGKSQHESIEKNKQQQMKKAHTIQTQTMER